MFNDVLVCLCFIGVTIVSEESKFLARQVRTILPLQSLSFHSHNSLNLFMVLVGVYGSSVGLASDECTAPCPAGSYCPLGTSNGSSFRCPAGRYGVCYIAAYICTSIFLTIIGGAACFIMVML